MKINTFIRACVFFGTLLSPTIIFCADRNPRPEEVQAGIFSCCECLWTCIREQQTYNPVQSHVEAPPARKKQPTVIRTTHQALSAMLQEDDQTEGITALRELYLKSQGLNFSRFYTLSRAVENYLIVRELISPEGLVKNPEVVLNLLLSDKNTLSPEDWYFHQQIKDLMIRQAPIIEELRSKAKSPASIEATTLDLLFVEYYGLLATADSITTEEIHTILAECDQPERGPFRLKDLANYNEHSASSVIIKK